MNSGCNDCPAFAKCTVTYRGSACKALRESYGVHTDPKSNADRIRGMSDEELATLLMCDSSDRCFKGDCDNCFREELDWLRQPAEE